MRQRGLTWRSSKAVAIVYLHHGRGYGATPGCLVVLTADDYFGVSKSGSGCDMKESSFAHRQTVQTKWGKVYLPSSSSPCMAAVLTPAAGAPSGFPWWRKHGELQDTGRLVDTSWLASLLADWAFDASINSGSSCGGGRSISHYSYATSRPALLIWRTNGDSSASSRNSWSNMEENLVEALQRLRSSTFLNIVLCEQWSQIHPPSAGANYRNNVCDSLSSVAKDIEEWKYCFSKSRPFCPN